MKLGSHIDFKFCPMCANHLVEGHIDGAIRRYCQRCGWIHYLNPAVVVCAIACCNSKVVLIKRGVEPAKDKWSLPGGFVDVLEEPRSAVLRELEEEAGIKGDDPQLIDVVHQDSSRYTSVIVIGYEIEFNNMLSLKAGDDAVSADWVGVDEIKNLPFESFNRIFNTWRIKRCTLH